METVLRKWGNSVALRIPAQALKSAKLRVDETVDLRVEDDRIVISARGAPAPSLDDLVAAISPGNLHEAIDTGPAVGNEAW